jgi:hypothetical protein
MALDVPRTRYCFDQNPKRRELLRTGKWDPAKTVATRIAKLEASSRNRRLH